MLELKNVSLVRKNKTVLDDISFNIKPGKLVAIIGPNGAGKSSLLKVLSGHLVPDKGEVLLLNQAIKEWGEKKSQYCALLSQKPALAFDFTVKEIVALGRYPYRHLALRLNEAIISRYIKLLDLEGIRDQAYSNLSGGEQQRVHLARLLAQVDNSFTEKFLLLDEHMAHLDLTYQYWSFQYLRSIADKGAGVVVISHDMAMLRKFADEVLVLKQGKLYKKGVPSEALSDQVLKEVFQIPNF